ncbi:MAG: hypothetical protein MMC33_004647 [Icmadophila ericetorum]|nr:hypothetical protein [Icmadophila ericetorum]
MASPLGFSVGDFIAGINLFIDCVKAVRDSRGATAEFQTLTNELKSLRGVLQAIEGLYLQQNAANHYPAVDAMVQETKHCIELFVKRNSSYRPWLQPQTRGWKANFKKIKWTLCKKEDLVEFRGQLERQKSSIEMLLFAIQIKQGQEVKKALEDSQEIARAGHAATCDILNGLSKLHTDCSQRSLLREQQLMEEIALLRREIPPQVLFQRPIIFLDACGKMFPFHLELVTSTEAFISVLKFRFKQYGVTTEGIGKLDRSEFAVCSRIVRLLSVQSKKLTINSSSCGLQYRRIVELDLPLAQNVAKFESDTSKDGTPDYNIIMETQSMKADVLDEFRRVQVISSDINSTIRNKTSVLSSMKPLRSRFKYWQCIGPYSIPELERRFGKYNAQIKSDFWASADLHLKEIRENSAEAVNRQRGDVPGASELSEP